MDAQSFVPLSEDEEQVEQETITARCCDLTCFLAQPQVPLISRQCSEKHALTAAVSVREFLSLLDLLLRSNT